MSRQIMVCRLVTPLLLCLSVPAPAATVPDRRVGVEPRPSSRQSAKGKMKKQTVKESPFTCNVSGLDSTQRQRWEALVAKLSEAKQEVRELRDGYAFRFNADSEMVKEIAEFIIYERLCCPFFDFEVVVEREGGPLWLRLKGRSGVKAFIRSEFGL